MKINRLPIFVLLLCILLFMVIGVQAMTNLVSLNFLPIIQKDVLILPPIPSPTSTPYPTPGYTPPPPHITGNIDITSIFYNGSGSSEPDEYVEIRNADSFSIQLQNWTLSDSASHIYSFPAYTISPGQTCRIYTNQNHPEWCGFNYGSGVAIWNNTGDCGYLRDRTSILIDDYCY